MSLIDEIEIFRHRYVVINNGTNLARLKKWISKKVHDEISADLNNQWGYRHFIVDMVEKKILIKSVESFEKSFVLDKKKKKDFNSLKFLEDYKIPRVYGYNMSRVNYQGDLVQMYGIESIWIALLYKTKSNNERLIINKNMFGTFKIVNTREFVINQILGDVY